MSLVITQRPQATISGEISKWNAVGNPIVYKFQRSDYIVTQFQNNGGFVDITINGIDLTAVFTGGKEIVFGSDDGTYDHVYATVTSSLLTFGNTHITVSTSYTSSASAGFVNILDSKLQYRVQVNLYDENDVLINAEPFLYSPLANGSLAVNVSGIIRKALKPDNDIDLSSDTIYDDVSVYKAFYIATTEIWTGSAESEDADDSNIFYAVFAGLQIPSAYGGNMALYTSFDDGTPKALFLTKLERLKLWRGYPLMISAIIGDNVTSQVYFSIQYFDGDGNIVGSQGTVEDTYTGKILEVIPSNILAVPDDAVSGRIWITNYDDNVLLTDYLYFDIEDACDNPIYLIARNSLGGVIQWVFDGSQDRGFNYDNDVKSASYTLFAENLTINEWNALQDFIGLGSVYRENITEFTASTIKTSSRVGQQVYAVDADGNKVGVIVRVSSPSTMTKNVKHEFSIDIDYPEEFVP